MCNIKLVYLLINLFILNVLVGCCEFPIVETSHGKVQGKVMVADISNSVYYGFTGIPYAAPPVNELRFAPPQPVDLWEGTLLCIKEKPACIQFNNNVKKGQPFGVYGSEDCLHLDVFTRSYNSDEKQPVIVFLYNEHFRESYNKTKDYSPDFFMEENVVIVTISHRLSVFGFLSLEDESMPGNAGLKDIVLGLKWVKENIHHFGGDPDKITLMGSQGGAAAVDLLLHSNKKGLINAAILQSGVSWTSAYLQEGVRDRAFNLGELIESPSGSSTILLKDLIEAPASILLSKDLHASPKDYFKENQKSVVAFGPIVEKDPNGLIVEHPEKSLEKINVPILIGSNSREGLEASMQYLIEPRFITYLRKDFPFLLPRRVNFRFDPTRDSFFDAVNEIKEFYFNKGNINLRSVPELVTYMGDTYIGYATDYVAKMYSNKSSNSVYYYHFDYYSDLNENKNNIMKHATVEDGTWGAATGDELCYLFKCPDLRKVYKKHEQNKSEEWKMVKKLVRMWANFAKYGNPTPEGDELLEGLKWPSYNLDTKEYLQIDKEITVKEDLNKIRYDFWDSFIKKWEQRATNDVITESNLENNKDEL